MFNRKSVLTALGVLGLCTGGASADFLIGEPIIIENGPQSVSVHFMSSESGWDGVLWLAGTSSFDENDTPLFFNHDGALGFEHYLGAYETGDRLDFIYDVLTGQPNSFRTTDPVGIMQFGWEWSTSDIILVGVEDMELPGGDGDYNNMMFEVRMTPIPAPPAAATGGVALLGMLGVRRRRC